MTQQTLKGVVAVVTGASSGIGHATAKLLAARGAAVACVARRAERLEALVAEIRRGGGTAMAAACDVAERGQVVDAFGRVAEALGPVDALVNNAGVMPLSKMEACRVDDWDYMVRVNINGVLYGVAAVLPSMVERRRGHIVNVSSVAGRRVFAAGAVYCATKHAVHSLSEGMRMELAAHNIRVTIVAPGLVSTELQHHIPDEAVRENVLQRMREKPPLRPEDVGAAVVYALESPENVGINEVLLRPTWQEP